VSGAAPDARLLATGLSAAGLDPAMAPALASEVVDYAARQDVQVRAERDLAEVQAPVRRLPELPPPMDLGGLFELADTLNVTDWSAV
jgi:hypothetical protein